MGASIAIVGLAANDPVPGTYIEVDFAAGPPIAGLTQYSVLLLGNRMTTGTATVDTVIYGPDTATPLAQEADAIALFGEGSELHRMWKRFFKVNTTQSVYALAVTESVGAFATGVATLATTATSNGTLRIYVGDEFVDSAITSGDTAIVAAGNACTAINSKTWWPVTAANSGTAVITLTAKQKGLRGNWLRYWSRMLTACGMTTSTATPAFFTGGTTADSNTTALTTILPKRFYYIVSAAEDATQLGALVTQVNTQGQPTNGIRQRVIGGSVDTLANAQTIATGLNAARAEVVLLTQGDVPPSELAANSAAVYSLEEQPRKFKCNFSGYGNDANSSLNWKIPAPLSGVQPTRANIKSALNNGLTPIGVNPNGSTYLVKRCTSRSLNGSNPDYRIRDAHKVTICDRYADDMGSKVSLQFAGKNIGDDPVGQQPGPGASVVTPRMLKAAANKLTRDYFDIDLVQNVQAIISGTLANRESSPTTRLTCSIPLQPVDILDQIGVLILQVA
jgi:phage tail sheath gpL-like